MIAFGHSSQKLTIAAAACAATRGVFKSDIAVKRAYN